VRIVGLAPNAWDGQWVNRQHLLSRLARRHDVLYSTGAWSIWQRNWPEFRRSPMLGCIVRRDEVYVDHPPRYLLGWPRFKAWDRAVHALHARRLRRWLRGKEGTQTIAMVFHPGFVPFLEHLRPQKVAYHAYDLFRATPGWTARLRALERQLLETADLVTTVSDDIAECLRSDVQRDVKVLPNGVDFELFSGFSDDVPADLARIPRPRLGYVGSLHPQIDFSLVAEMAERRDDWHWVFVGARSPINDSAAQDSIARCQRLPNVHFLGEKDRSEVPAYVSRMDVNLMLYRTDTESWVNVGYPLKLHEYLATGVPVVSSDVRVVRQFDRVVRIAAGVDDWMAAIFEALESGGRGSPESRRTVARQNTWDARAAQLEAWLGAIASESA
jgi:glycosyltransferase involved in cell wall biosynthesis